MPDLKLAKLPERTPVKISFKASPELNRSLEAYAAFYRDNYGEEEAVAELIPYMLETFLKSDSAFNKARRENAAGTTLPEAKRSKSRHAAPAIA